MIIAWEGKGEEEEEEEEEDEVEGVEGEEEGEGEGAYHWCSGFLFSVHSFKPVLKVKSSKIDLSDTSINLKFSLAVSDFSDFTVPPKA